MNNEALIRIEYRQQLICMALCHILNKDCKPGDSKHAVATLLRYAGEPRPLTRNVNDQIREYMAECRS